MVGQGEILAGVIELEPVDAGRPSDRATPTVRPRQVTVVMAALLAAVLVAGSLAGRRASDRPHHRLNFDQPPPGATLFDTAVGDPEARFREDPLRMVRAVRYSGVDMLTALAAGARP